MIPGHSPGEPSPLVPLPSPRKGNEGYWGSPPMPPSRGLCPLWTPSRRRLPGRIPFVTKCEKHSILAAVSVPASASLQRGFRSVLLAFPDHNLERCAPSRIPRTGLGRREQCLNPRRAKRPHKRFRRLQVWRGCHGYPFLRHCHLPEPRLRALFTKWRTGREARCPPQRSRRRACAPAPAATHRRVQS